MKAGDATSGPREEHVGQHVDGRTARRKSQAREEELEQATSRDVKRDEQPQREPAVRQRQALDGGRYHSGKSGPTPGKRATTAERENLSTAEEPQRAGNQTVDAYEVAGLPTSWAATTNVTDTQLEPD